MTKPSSSESGAAAPAASRSETEGNDHKPYDFKYDHGRMPLFMKLLWLAFLAFGAWYTVSFLLTELGEELGAG